MASDNDNWTPNIENTVIQAAKLRDACKAAEHAAAANPDLHENEKELIQTVTNQVRDAAKVLSSASDNPEQAGEFVEAVRDRLNTTRLPSVTETGKLHDSRALIDLETVVDEVLNDLPDR